MLLRGLAQYGSARLLKGNPTHEALANPSIGSVFTLNLLVSGGLVVEEPVVWHGEGLVVRSLRPLQLLDLVDCAAQPQRRAAGDLSATISLPS